VGTELLVENRIDDGQRLLIELVRDGFDVSAAAWLKTSEEGLWFLYIGSKSVDAGKLANAYRTVYACLRRIPDSWIDMSAVKLVHDTNPIARDVVAIRDRYPGGRIPTRYGGERIGNIAIEEAYLYPRITPGLTRDEIVQAVTGLLNRTGLVRPSTVTLRDGTVIRGIPFGIEMKRAAGRPSVLEIKLLDDTDGSAHSIPVDDVTNLQ
jgi:hypothetical protein